MNILGIASIVLASIAATLSGLAVIFRVKVTFDVNKYLENRRKTKIERLKNICPHAYLDPDTIEEDKIFGGSYFYTKFGITGFICQQCGLYVEFEEQRDRAIPKDPLVIVQMQEKFNKELKS